MSTTDLSIGLHVRTGTKHTSAVRMATRADVGAFHACLGHLIRKHFGAFDEAITSKVAPKRTGARATPFWCSE